ncbi:unnamed protein product [Brassica oleracea]
MDKFNLNDDKGLWFRVKGGFRHRPRPPKLNLLALLFNAPGDEMFTCRLVNLLPLSNSEINYVMLLNKQRSSDFGEVSMDSTAQKDDFQHQQGEEIYDLVMIFN